MMSITITATARTAPQLLDVYDEKHCGRDGEREDEIVEVGP